MLHTLDGKLERTFTVPCGNRIVGGPDYVDLVRDQFIAINVASGAIVPSMHTLDLHRVPVAAPTCLGLNRSKCKQQVGCLEVIVEPLQAKTSTERRRRHQRK